MSGVTGNAFSLDGNANATATGNIPAGMDWFMLYAMQGTPVNVAFDNDPPIPFDVRTVRMGSFSRLTFSRRCTLDDNVIVGYFLYGKGEPPDFPSIQDADCFHYPLAPATTNIGPGPGGVLVWEGWLLDTGIQARAFTVSVAEGAANGVFVLGGFGIVGNDAEGDFLAPGQSRRYPSGDYAPIVYNAQNSTVQTYIVVELVK